MGQIFGKKNEMISKLLDKIRFNHPRKVAAALLPNLDK